MAQPIRFVAIGDTHTGSTTGLAPKTRVTNAGQAWLLETYNGAVKEIIKGGPFILGLGADLVDGHHHNSRQVWGNWKEQRDASIELLQPLANKAIAIYGLLGTEAHSGDAGEHDHQVAQELGAKHIGQHLTLRIAGRILSWAHHGLSVSRMGWLNDSGLISAIRQIDDAHLRGRIKHRPDCLISHHAHRSPKPATLRGITAGVCGCWQLPTPHGFKISPRDSVDIGYLVWYPDTNLLEPVIYAQEQILTEFKTSR